MVVPASFLGDALKGLVSRYVSPTLPAPAGGAADQIRRGIERAVGGLPFAVVPQGVQPQSATGPTPTAGTDEDVVLVPAGFLGGLLGGLGGGLLGGTVGKWFGNEQAGSAIGKAAGGVLGGMMPFQVVPPDVVPASAGPDAPAAPQEDMVLVPAGFFGNLLGGLAKTVGGMVGGSTGRTIGDTAGTLISRFVPFSEVPPEVVPQSTGPQGTTAEDERLIVLPAGFFGNLLSGLAGTVGKAIGGALGDARTGEDVGNAVSPILSWIPFQALPSELQPASAVPGTEAGAKEELVLVPAGLFGNLLSGLAGTVGKAIGGAFGDARTGEDVGNAVAPVLRLFPFSVVPPVGVGAAV
ncbi:hypothetical protein GC089_08645 [Cellulomonas sp. JZ18]|uniref:hypothetical protein n=1 Tax=Cellulomonas sp. JZ18 TaxID=2654191 RepID=UPI0012D4851C|nr:hypothetical protein [Cellulomonas sp. JZ18]QGQ19287.1 hypothetical protein GC089_08645 [Cellulomonas sp. JZ18]